MTVYTNTTLYKREVDQCHNGLHVKLDKTSHGNGSKVA